jgi:16S rRNA (guanine527-N7)-methyltransferase
MPADAAGFGPEAFQAATNVSRETLERLKTYGAMLEEWNQVHNLVSRGSLAHVWQRHFLDSAQLAPLIPAGATSLVDLGAGAGFPGLVLAELMRERPGFHTVLYESTAKKCRFLQAVTDQLGLNVEIRNERIEDAVRERFDVVSARALAPMSQLLAYAQTFWGRGTIALFLKGRNLGPELTEAHKSWKIEDIQHPSQSDPDGIVLEVRELRYVQQRPRAENRP